MPISRIYEHITLKYCVLSFVASLGFSLTPAFADDCTELLSILDQEIAQVGTLIGDEETVRGSVSLIQARVLRESANILRERDENDACEDTVEEARDLVKLTLKPAIFAAEDLVGRDVVDIQGEEVGEIVNIMVDLDHGVVAYALIEFGGFLGLGEELIPVPFNKIRQQSEDEALLILIEPAKLESAPRYDGEATNQLSQRKWANKTYRYYGESPYWRNPDQSEQTPTNDPGDQVVVTVAGEVDVDNQNQNLADSEESKQLDEKKNASADRKQNLEIKSFDDLFISLDADGDSAIDEKESGREFVIMKRFAQLDENDDGSLSQSEFSKLANTHKLSSNGEGLTSKAKDAMPEEK